MNEIKESTIEMMDDIAECLANAVMVVLAWVWIALVIVTTPIWVIPYLIIKKRKDKLNDR